MKEKGLTMTYSIKATGLLILSAFLLSCASGQTRPISTELPIIDVGKYLVKPPNDENWQIDVDKEKDSIQFIRHKKWWTGKILGTTSIYVHRIVIAPAMWQLSEEAVANEYFNREEIELITGGVIKKQYGLSGVKRETAYLDGKKLYLMLFNTSRSSAFSTFVMENAYYLYFPPDFKRNHAFYGFLIIDGYERGTNVTLDLSQVKTVIKSLIIK